jgi:hypothetical protein
MRWLPEYGVGIVALANRTYAGPGRAVGDAFDALFRSGALQPRVVQPGPELVRTRQAVDALIDAWDDARATGLAADNFFLDRPREARRHDFAELAAKHGACRPDGAIDAENALRGEWRLACERGFLRVAVTLAPTLPPKLQSLSVVSSLPMGARLSEAARLVASSVGSAPPDVLLPWLAPSVDPGPIARVLHSAAAWGACQLGEVRRGGGESQATVRLHCSKGDLDAQLSIDDASGKLKSLGLVPSPDLACVP